MCFSFSFVVPSEQLEEEQEDVQDVEEDAAAIGTASSWPERRSRLKSRSV
jgi:hypothetical protein